MPKFAPVLLAFLLAACGGGGSDAVAQPAATAPTAQALPVYLFLGQSNMVATGAKVDELPAQLRAPQSALIFADGHWSPLAVAAAAPFGPEVSFAARMGPVRIVKVAQGATSLAVDWAPGSALYARAVAEARAAAAAAGAPVKFRAAFWMQGESDTCCQDEAAAYAANLRTLVGNLRRDLDAPDMEFVAARIHPEGPTYLFTDAVRAALMAPGIGNYAWVDLDALPRLRENGALVHYTTAGILRMGELFADAVLSGNAGR